MKRAAVGWILLLFSFVLLAPKVASGADDATSSEAVVQKQVEAYNARDIERFLATYSQMSNYSSIRTSCWPEV